MGRELAPRRPTGGQLNVSGILYQMLASLAEGLDATAISIAAGNTAATVELVSEPFEGGDFAVFGTGRTVVQVKRRASHRRWTFADIVGSVLRDLLKGVRPGEHDAFRFMTDNDDGCGDFRRFLAWRRKVATTAPGEAVPNEWFRVGQGGRRVDAHGFLQAVCETLGVGDDSDGRLATLLDNLKIERKSEAELERDIERLIRTMAERVQDAAAKRSQLIGDLLPLAAAGTKACTSDLLRAAQLDPHRLAHAGNLATTLRTRLFADLPAFRYDPEGDIRQPLHAPTSPVTVLRGESGLGKTWRLCATAAAMADAGRPVVMLRASTDVDRLRERIATAVWNPSYSEQLPLPSIAARLRPALGDDRGVWLTVFLDDLNDPALARSVVEARWDDLGIDLVISAQPATAESLRTSFAAPQMVDVPEFSTPELVDLLDRHGVNYSRVQDDVFGLLHRPVLAALYCRLPADLMLSEETEYQLMQSFWDHSAAAPLSSTPQTFDLDRLQLLVGDMLAAPPAYPWPLSTFVNFVDEDTIDRLVRRGLVELDGDRRLSMTNDRLLNWTMARHLADQARDQALGPPAVLELLRRTEEMVNVAGVRIGAGFGYVLMDLLWLLLDTGRWQPALVAELLMLHMRDPEFGSYDREFFRRSLPTLGARAVPLFRAMTAIRLDVDREVFRPAWLAEGMRKVADVAWEDVRCAAVGMFTNGDDVQREIALRVMGKIGAPELLEELHALNLTRAFALDDVDQDGRMDRIREKERSAKAFARAAASSPAWLDARIASASETLEAEQLLSGLLQLDRASGVPIWRRRRDHLFGVIRPTARILPRAVRIFADPDDLPRLSLPPPDGADLLHGAATFDAIARLDPERSIGILGHDAGDRELDLRGTDRWWMPGLHHRCGARLGGALRQGVTWDNAPDRVDRLARIYGGAPDLMDPDTTAILLDALEIVLNAKGVPPDERLRRGWHLLSTLSSVRTAGPLACIAARRGTPLEDALSTLAAGQPPSSSRLVDRDGQMMARILAMMAGDGFDRLTLAQIASEGHTTRGYGLKHALWTESVDVGAALDGLEDVNAADDHDGPYYLMQALAAHGRDAGIAKLISASSPVYTYAVDIWQGRRGDDREAALADQVRAWVASDDPNARVKAVDLSHFLPAEQALELTAPLIPLAGKDNQLARRLLMLHFQHAHYEPGLHASIEPMLRVAGDHSETAALHLALHGDARARRTVACWLAGPRSESAGWRSIQVAMTLVEHEDSRAEAIAHLELLRGWRHHGRMDAEVLEALARHGDALASEELVHLAYGTSEKDLDVVAGALRILARQGSAGAFQAARRLYARSGQQEAARLLVETNAAEGLAELVTAYVGAPLPQQLTIARTLRWHASAERLLPELVAMAGSANEANRAAAAEIAGWLPHGWDMPLLDILADDPVREVEGAALEAIRRRANGREAEELLRKIPGLPKPAKWAALCALTELVDPHLLSWPGDPLDIRPLLASLPAEFGIEAQRVIDQRRKNVDKEVDRIVKRDARD